ncbi:replicative DNA helicase [Candidatus Azambacteria bacterium]|nr:replicative DNA helicase [Candidatus Azambacteria bacterium]
MADGPRLKKDILAAIPDRLPPQNIEAEQSVLGALMLDRDAIIKVADVLKTEDFYRGSHQSIYRAMLALFERREPIDILSLSARLKEAGLLEDIGGMSYLTSLVNAVPTASHVAHYAKIVARKKVLRDLIAASYEIGELAYKETEDVETLLDKVEAKIFAISQTGVGEQFQAVNAALEEAFERHDRLHQGDVGKTSLALDIARHVATEARIPVGIFSLEMSKESLVDRLIASEARVDLWKLRTGRLSFEGETSDFIRIRDALARLSEAPMYIDDAASPNVMQMRTMSRRLQAEHGLGLLIVDYLQLMQGRSTENRVQEIGEITRGLKSLAKELSIPIIAISQLSRAPEHRPDQRPRLSDLRESGNIEQDADVVLFIYREDRVKKETERRNIADILIAKHRNGPIGSVELYFNEQQTSFKNLEKRYTEEAALT